jgi:RNA polymerase sigma-70 factor, ECF subfamily
VTREAIQAADKCYKVGAASTIDIMGRHAENSGSREQNELYTRAVAECGRMLDRLSAGYEVDPDKRRDLRQEIHLQLWSSFGAFDGRCSFKTWTLRVAHNTAASYVIREKRMNEKLVSFEDIEQTLASVDQPTDIDRERELQEVQQVILKLKPLDRQIIISYLEGIDAASMADITGLTPANIAMKIHRIKKILAHRIREEQSHA